MIAIGGIYGVRQVVGFLVIHRAETVTVGNFNEIDHALLKFEGTYGNFPNEETIAKVRQDSQSPLDMGTENSNDYFRQLIALDMVTEKEFRLPDKGITEPDGNVAVGEALKKGECRYAYCAGWGNVSDNRGRRPLMFGPIIPGTRRFDREAINGKIVVLFADGHIERLRMEKDGSVKFHGKDLLDPSNLAWGGTLTFIAWPE